MRRIQRFAVRHVGRDRAVTEQPRSAKASPKAMNGQAWQHRGAREPSTTIAAASSTQAAAMIPSPGVCCAASWLMTCCTAESPGAVSRGPSATAAANRAIAPCG